MLVKHAIVKARTLHLFWDHILGGIERANELWRPFAELRAACWKQETANTSLWDYITRIWFFVYHLTLLPCLQRQTWRILSACTVSGQTHTDAAARTWGQASAGFRLREFSWSSKDKWQKGSGNCLFHGLLLLCGWVVVIRGETSAPAFLRKPWPSTDRGLGHKAQDV